MTLKLSSLSRGYGTLDGAVVFDHSVPVCDDVDHDVDWSKNDLLKLPKISVKKILPSIKDSCKPKDDEGTIQDDLPLPNGPGDGSDVPKTFSTRSGALILFSDDGFVEGQKRRKRRRRRNVQFEGFSEEEELDDITFGKFKEILLDLEDDIKNHHLLTKLWGEKLKDESFIDVRPGFSPNRYMASMSTFWDPAVIDKFLTEKKIHSATLKKYLASGYRLPKIKADQKSDHLLQRRPRPYSTFSLPNLSIDRKPSDLDKARDTKPKNTKSVPDLQKQSLSTASKSNKNVDLDSIGNDELAKQRSMKPKLIQLTFPGTNADAHSGYSDDFLSDDMDSISSEELRKVDSSTVSSEAPSETESFMALKEKVGYKGHGGQQGLTLPKIHEETFPKQVGLMNIILTDDFSNKKGKKFVRWQRLPSDSYRGHDDISSQCQTLNEDKSRINEDMHRREFPAADMYAEYHRDLRSERHEEASIGPPSSIDSTESNSIHLPSIAIKGQSLGAKHAPSLGSGNWSGARDAGDVSNTRVKSFDSSVGDSECGDRSKRLPKGKLPVINESVLGMPYDTNSSIENESKPRLPSISQSRANLSSFDEIDKVLEENTKLHIKGRSVDIDDVRIDLPRYDPSEQKHFTSEASESEGYDSSEDGDGDNDAWAGRNIREYEKEVGLKTMKQQGDDNTSTRSLDKKPGTDVLESSDTVPEFGIDKTSEDSHPGQDLSQGPTGISTEYKDQDPKTNGTKSNPNEEARKESESTKTMSVVDDKTLTRHPSIEDGRHSVCDGTDDLQSKEEDSEHEENIITAHKDIDDDAEKQSIALESENNEGSKQVERVASIANESVHDGSVERFTAEEAALTEPETQQLPSSKVESEEKSSSLDIECSKLSADPKTNGTKSNPNEEARKESESTKTMSVVDDKTLTRHPSIEDGRHSVCDGTDDLQSKEEDSEHEENIITAHKDIDDDAEKQSIALESENNEGSKQVERVASIANESVHDGSVERFTAEEAALTEPETQQLPSSKVESEEKSSSLDIECSKLSAGLEISATDHALTEVVETQDVLHPGAIANAKAVSAKQGDNKSSSLVGIGDASEGRISSQADFVDALEAIVNEVNDITEGQRAAKALKTSKQRKTKGTKNVKKGKGKVVSPPFHAGRVEDDKVPTGLDSQNSKETSTEPSNQSTNGQTVEKLSKPVPKGQKSKRKKKVKKSILEDFRRVMDKTEKKESPSETGPKQEGATDVIASDQTAVVSATDTNTKDVIQDDDQTCSESIVQQTGPGNASNEEEVLKGRGDDSRESSIVGDDNITDHVETDTDQQNNKIKISTVSDAKLQGRKLAAEKRRLEVEKRRIEKQLERERAAIEAAKEEKLKQEAEEEKQRRIEEYKRRKEEEERERKKQEEEELENERKLLSRKDRERRQREEERKKMEQMVAQLRLEEEIRKERERIALEVEKELKKQEEEMLSKLAEDERKAYLEKQKVEEEERKRMEEECRKKEEELRQAEKVKQEQLMKELEELKEKAREKNCFIEKLRLGSMFLSYEHKLTRAFTYSYFDQLSGMIMDYSSLNLDSSPGDTPPKLLTMREEVPEEL